MIITATGMKQQLLVFYGVNIGILKVFLYLSKVDSDKMKAIIDLQSILLSSHSKNIIS